MKNIHEILQDVIRREGGYVNHPADRGGATKYGITQRTLSQYLGRQASIEEVKTLEVSQAEEIYMRNYVVFPRFDTLPPFVVPIMVDMGILHGPKRAIMFLQSVLNQAGFGPIDVDGVLGPQTRDKTVNAVDEMQGYLINALVDERIGFVEQIVANRPSQSVFLKGWKNRAEEFRVSIPG